MKQIYVSWLIPKQDVNLYLYSINVPFLLTDIYILALIQFQLCIPVTTTWMIKQLKRLHKIEHWIYYNLLIDSYFRNDLKN